MSITATTKSISTVSAQKYNQVKSELDEYVHYSNKKTDRIIELEINLEKAAIKFDTLLGKYNDLLDKNVDITKELEMWKTQCPVDGLPVAECGGYDCSECQILIDHKNSI